MLNDIVGLSWLTSLFSIAWIYSGGSCHLYKKGIRGCASVGISHCSTFHRKVYARVPKKSLELTIKFSTAQELPFFVGVRLYQVCVFSLTL